MNEIREQLAAMRSNAASSEGADDGGESPVQENNTCVICLVNAREIALRPCGHVCTCLSCYEAMPNRKLCPVCRAAVTEIVAVYIP